MTVHPGRGTAFQLVLPGRARRTSVLTPVYGLHNVANALAAAGVGALCQLSGIKIARGLSRFRPAAMRSQVETMDGLTVINDCYNANPASMKAAVNLLVELATGARTIAVLGNMLELGPESPMLHQEIGAYLAGRDVSLLVACGTLGREIARGARDAGMSSDRIREVEDAVEAAKLLASMLRRRDTVLVKGSRGMRMEQIVESLRRRLSLSAPARRRLAR
jgi:UDP-N-acetylmuramoyl-tripeptide--D-alanyl-D-alanine ligase